MPFYSHHLSPSISENKGRTTITESSDNEKRSCEGLEEFITPPLCTIPGIELEYKLEECDSETLSLSEVCSFFKVTK